MRLSFAFVLGTVVVVASCTGRTNVQCLENGNCDLSGGGGGGRLP